MNTERADRISAALLLAPVLLCSWPWSGAVLRHDVTPQATGIGFVALALIPSALFLALRRMSHAIPALLLFLVPTLVAMFWVSIDHSTDTFEGSRVLMHWIVALHCLLVGASLGPAGRAWLVRGIVFISAVFISFALFDQERAFTGALGNTGSISEAGLPGAVVGAVLLVLGAGVWRIVGALTWLVFLAYTTRVPVLAGSLSAAVGCAALVVAVRGLTNARRALAAILLACTLAAIVIPFAQRDSQNPSGGTVVASAGTAVGPAGGVGVRFMIWQSSVALLAEHPLLGVGAGQFAARFPEHRAQAEIERTTYGRRRAEETEVEHPHNDWFAPWLEGGLVAGVAWTLFLLLVARAALSKMATREPLYVAVGAGALAVLANAFVRGPLLWNPASSPLAFALFGVVLAREADGTRMLARRFVVIGSALLMLAISVRALAFVRHGFALQSVAAVDAEVEDVRAAVAEALAACPDSALALSTSARLSEGRGDASDFVIDAWTQVLEVRPQRIEALLHVANALTKDRPDHAREAYRRVLRLDSTHPVAIQNLGTLALNDGNVAEGLAFFDSLPAARTPTQDWFEHLAARLALRGIDDAAETLFVRVDPQFADPIGEQCLAFAKQAEAAGRGADIVDAWKARAHRRFARDHAAAGRFGDAVRSYRQDLYWCEIHTPAPRRVLLELSAALERAGKSDESRDRAAGLTPTATDLSALPDWARTTLQARLEQAKN